MSNLFTTENIKKNNTKNDNYGVGEWVIRNGENAMRLCPAPFYQNYTVDSTKISYLLRDEFVSNTQYIFDLWFDSDDVVYQGNNVPGGLVIYYTDGTKNEITSTGGSKGFIHKKFITPSTKSINRVEVYYYTNTPVYYRWDSHITPVMDSNFQKNGLMTCGGIIENSNSMSIEYGGIIHLEDFIEY